MDSGTVVKQLVEGYGEKPEGFEEYLQTKCKRIEPFMSPNIVPDQSVGYDLPEGIRLQELMVQPFFQRDTIKARKNDIIIASYPKTGTTWMQEICYTILSKGDFSKANAIPLDQRMLFFEIPVGGVKAFDESKENPRIIKTHLLYSLLPKNFVENKTKIIYITRNPKDVFISSYYFHKHLIYIGYTGTLTEFMDHFLTGRIMYSSFADNVLSYWNRRDQDNIFFITYEQLHKDAKGSIEKVAEFIGQELTEEQIDAIVDHTSFEQMSENPMTNYSTGAGVCSYGGKFMRKGKVGDWKNHLDDEMNRKLEDYIKKNFEGTGLEFDYEI